MNSCPRCGGVRGQHGSILEGCICHWQSTQEKCRIDAVPAKGTLLSKREWVGLNWDDLPEIYVGDTAFLHGAKWAERVLKDKNNG